MDSKPFDPDEIRVIIDHMNDDHGEALQLYVKAFAPDYADKLEHTTMTGIDSTGISIDCHYAESTKEIKINFADTGVGGPINRLAQCRGILVAMASTARKICS